MSQEQTIQRLNDRIAELEEEIRQLKAAQVPPAITAPPEWGLTPSEEGLAVAFAKHGTLSKEACMTALWKDKWDLDGLPEPKLVDVVVCKLRKKLTPHGVIIKTIWGRGYEMPPESRALFQRREKA